MGVIDRFRGDLRYALRHLTHRPLWTLVVVGTLALGIGANTAIFSLVDTMLFKPAAWNTQDRLVWISSFSARYGHMGSMSYPDYVAYRDRATTMSAVIASGGNAVAVGAAGAGGGRPQRALGILVSGNYFDVLGVHAALGRTFAPDEDSAPGAHPVVVLSDAFWRSHFGGDPGVINRTVAINGQPFTIIGVAPPGFTGLAYADNAEELWMPMAMQAVAIPGQPELMKAANTGWLHVVGRLRDGVSVAEADADMRVLARPLNPPGTPADREKSARVNPMRGGMTPWEQHDLGRVFGLIAIIPALVLLVACANVANVLMARDLSRRKELALRSAMGASRARLVQFLLTESLLLALLSAVAGFAVSLGMISLIARVGDVPADVIALLTPDMRALFATTALAMATTIVFGLAPALTATRFDVLPVLKDDGTTATMARGGTRMRGVLVVAQVAVSLALLITAGLFLQSLSRAMRIDPGFDPRGAVSASFDLNLQSYSAARRDAFVAQLLDRALTAPGVASAAVGTNLPLSGQSYGADVVAETKTQPAHATSTKISPRYFETLRVPLVRGRDFSAADAFDAPRVAIVNETLARRLWPGEDAIGKRLRVASANAKQLEPWREVVGVVRDTQGAYLTESAHGEYYVSLRQDPDGQLTVIARSTGNTPALALLPSIEGIVRDLDRDLPLFQAQTLDENVRHAVRLRRASASLIAVFGMLTLLLASIGVYGVAAHNVTRRTREIGIRMSLGARATDVLRLFVRESLSLSLIGVLMGLAISAAVSRILTSFLFGLTAMDALTFAAASTILCMVALAASYIPARRAAHVDPLVALRHD